MPEFLFRIDINLFEFVSRRIYAQLFALALYVGKDPYVDIVVLGIGRRALINIVLMDSYKRIHVLFVQVYEFTA